VTEASKGAHTSYQDDDERERLLVEQLPQVHYIARRIHERLRAMCCSKTWSMPGWLG
jgi:hypothetical protein